MTGTVENLNDQKDVNTLKIAKVLYDKGVAASMRGYSAGKERKFTRLCLEILRFDSSV